MKNCKYCEKELLDEAIVCPECGCSQEEEIVKPSGRLRVGSMVWSIFNLYFANLPLGLVSLLMTILAKFSRDEAEERQCLKAAKICNIISTVLLVLSVIFIVSFYLLYFVIYFFIMMAAMGGMAY